jgi:hypothetical protein
LLLLVPLALATLRARADTGTVTTSPFVSIGIFATPFDTPSSATFTIVNGGPHTVTPQVILMFDPNSSWWVATHVVFDFKVDGAVIAQAKFDNPGGNNSFGTTTQPNPVVVNLSAGQHTFSVNISSETGLMQGGPTISFIGMGASLDWKPAPVVVPDFILVTPKSSVLIGQQTFTAIGYKLNFAGEALPSPSLDPVTDAATLNANYTNLGPVNVNWTVDNSGSTAPVPDLRFITASPSVVAQPGTSGGILAPGVRATYSSNGVSLTDASTQVIVPYVSDVTVNNPDNTTSSPPPTKGNVRTTSTNKVAVLVGKEVVFGGVATPTDQNLRNEVSIKATIQPNIPAVASALTSITFRSFDAADEDTATAPWGSDPAQISGALTASGDDNRATEPAALAGLKHGLLVDPTTGAAGATPDVFQAPVAVDATTGNLVATVGFKTSLNQGDNYRVVATPHRVLTDTVSAMRPDSSGFGRLVTPDGSFVPDNTTTGAPASPMRSSLLISVWREVTIQIDIMLPVTNAEQMTPGMSGPQMVGGTILALDTTGTQVTIQPDTSVVTTQTCFLSLGQGFLDVGSKTYPTVAIDRVSSTSEAVTVTLGGGAFLRKHEIGNRCTLRDDDDLTLLPPDTTKALDAFLVAFESHLQQSFTSDTNALAPVFLFPKTRPAVPRPRRVPFQSHTDAPGTMGYAVQFWWDALYANDPAYYASYVLLGYQPARLFAPTDTAPTADADPNAGTPLGGTPLLSITLDNKSGVSHFFLETTRDELNRPAAPDKPYSSTDPTPLFARIIAREVAHGLGATGEDLLANPEAIDAPRHLLMNRILSPDASDYTLRPRDRALLRDFDPVTDRTAFLTR